MRAIIFRTVLLFSVLLLCTSAGRVHGQDTEIFHDQDSVFFLVTTTTTTERVTVDTLELGTVEDATQHIRALDRRYRRQRNRRVAQFVEAAYDSRHGQYEDLLAQLGYDLTLENANRLSGSMFGTDTATLVVPTDMIPTDDLPDFTDETDPGRTVRTLVYFKQSGSGVLRMRAVAPATGNWRVDIESPEDFTVKGFTGTAKNFFLSRSITRSRGTRLIYTTTSEALDGQRTASLRVLIRP